MGGVCRCSARRSLREGIGVSGGAGDDEDRDTGCTVFEQLCGSGGEGGTGGEDIIDNEDVTVFDLPRSGNAEDVFHAGVPGVPAENGLFA